MAAGEELKLYLHVVHGGGQTSGEIRAALPDGCPASYQKETLGSCQLNFDYPGCKLLDLVREKEEELRCSRKPTAWVIINEPRPKKDPPFFLFR